MKSNYPAIIAPLSNMNLVYGTFICLCKMIKNDSLICHSFPNLIKLGEIAMVHVVDNMEDEWNLSSRSFHKGKFIKCIRFSFGIL